MAKVEKVALVDHLPSDPVERKRLNKTLDELVELMLQQQDLKESIKDIVDAEKEMHNYKPSMIKFYAKLEFDKQHKAEKERKALEDKLEKVNELDILRGRSE